MARIGTYNQYFQGYHSQEDSSFVAGDSPTVIVMATEIDKQGEGGYIACDGAGDIQIELSFDGINYGDLITVKSGETFSLRNFQLESLRINHTGTDSSFRVVVY